MNKNLVAAILGLSALVSGIVPAAAQTTKGKPIELNGEVKVDKIVTENGEQRHVLSEPTKVLPGDKLVFATTWHNAGAVPVKNFVVTNPVPAPVMLAPEGAEALTVSVDGGKSWGSLASLKVASGNGALRSAEAADVTHIRWILAVVAPGATGTLTYHAIVR